VAAEPSHEGHGISSWAGDVTGAPTGAVARESPMAIRWKANPMTIAKIIMITVLMASNTQ
jgi:hypothetical protein